MDMHIPYNAQNPEELLTHASWMRGLARALVRNEDQAEDLSQEVILAALERPPGPLQNPKAWLSKVMSNTVIRNAIKEKNRVQREKLVAKQEAVSDLSETDEQLANHYRLVDLVKQLEEPYRSTIVLRFFQNLTPKEISEKLNIPSATVRTHLSRALEKLRAKLDREYGNREAWCIALLPLAGLKRAAVPAASSVSVAGIASILLDTKFQLAAAALGVLGFSFYFFYSDPSPDSSSSPRIAMVKDLPPENLNEEQSSLFDGNFREPLSQARNSSISNISPAKKEIPPKMIRCLVTDPFWTPVPNASIEAWKESQGSPHVRSNPTTIWTADSTGRFQFNYPSDATVLIASHPQVGISLVYEPLELDRVQELRIVLFKRVKVQGQVLNAHGNSVGHCEIKSQISRGWQGPVADGHPWIHQPIQSDHEGRFEIELCPKTTHLFSATTNNELSNAVTIPGKQGETHKLVLNFPGAFSFYGSIHFVEGQPIPGSEIRVWGVNPKTTEDPLDLRHEKVDSQGNFHIPMTCAGKYRIFASTPDFSQSSWSVVTLGQENIHAKLDMTLQPSTHISGRLVDSSGKPFSQVDLVATIESDPSTQYVLRMLPQESLTLDAKTDEQGRFYFPQIFPWSSYSISFGSSKQVSRRLLKGGVNPGTESLELIVSSEMLKQDFFTGKVLYPNSEEVVKEYELDFVREFVNSERVLELALVTNPEIVKNPDGTFRIGGLVHGKRYNVLVRVPGYLTVETSLLTAGVDKEIQLRLAEPVSLTCRLVDKNRQPVAGCKVSLRQPHCSIFFDRNFYATSDEHGLVHFPRLLPGHYRWLPNPGSCGGLTPRFTGTKPRHLEEFELNPGENPFVEVLVSE